MAYNIKSESGFLGFYFVDKAYADFLRDHVYGDVHVPFTKYDKRNKFFVGAVLVVNGMKYFAPVTSYTDKNDATFNIKNRHGEIISSVRPNYMFPVIDGVYEMLDIPNIKDVKYRYYVMDEYKYCSKHREEIVALAESMYSLRKQGKTATEYNKIYLIDFKKLEKRAKQYKKQ